MLQYSREGSGPPLLLIHGWGVHYSIWENIAPLLRTQFTLIMIELPGLGESPPANPEQPYYIACADAIEELRRHLGISRWAILAYSSGTRAAESYVQRYPKYVSHAIFLCPAYLTEISSLGVRLASWIDSTRPKVTEWVMTDWRLYGLVVALGFNGRRNAYSRSWMGEIRQQPLGDLKRMLYEMPGRGRAPFDLPPVPTLFIWSRRDAVIERPHRLNAASVTGAASHISIAANHSAPMFAADDIARVVTHFVANGQLSGVTQAKPWWSFPRAARLSRQERVALVNALKRERDLVLRLLRGASARGLPMRGLPLHRVARGRRFVRRPSGAPGRARTTPRPFRENVR